MGPRPLASDVQLRLFQRDDWAWITRWFQDEWLNRALGPMDRDWLDHVLQDRCGVQLVAMSAGMPLGCIGVVWGDAEHSFHTITDLAVDPAQRRQGWGRAVLSAAMLWDGHPPTPSWVAYVDPKNAAPAQMLLNMGWQETVSAVAMCRFETTLVQDSS